MSDKIACYINATEIGSATGDGRVGSEELAALREIAAVELVLDVNKLRPEIYNQPYSVFLQDIFARALIEKSGLSFDLCHIYGNTYGSTVDYLQRRGCKVAVTALMHNRKISIEEHERLMGVGTYPFWHVKDDFGFWVYTSHWRLADVIITPSRYSKQNIIEVLGNESKDKIVNIPHGVNIPATVTSPSGFTVAFLSQAGADKGLLYLIQAWSALGYNDAELILAGDGTERLEGFIKNIATRGKFRLLGRVPNVADVYNSCTIFCLPSSNEAWGIPLVEAMAHSRTVLTTSGCGASDAVTNGVDGFIVEPRSSEQLADKIQWFYENRDEIPIMGARAREKAKEYSWDKIRKKYIDVWKSIL